jgi:flagellar biosynthesis component FlhA
MYKGKVVRYKAGNSISHMFVILENKLQLTGIDPNFEYMLTSHCATSDVIDATEASLDQLEYIMINLVSHSERPDSNKALCVLVKNATTEKPFFFTTKETKNWLKLKLRSLISWIYEC